MNILQLAFLASLSLATPAERGVVGASKPDLTCSVRVSHDAAGTQLVSNGGSAASGGGSPSLYVHIIVTNKGITDAKLAAHSISVKRNSSTIKSTSESLAIPAGLSKIYDPIQVTLPSTSNRLSVVVRTDASSQVSELNERNNVCRFTFDYSISH